MSDCRFGVSPVNYPDPDPVGFSFLSLSKAMNNSKGVQEKDQIMICFYIYILQTFGRLVTVRLSCRKDHRPFGCCEILRPSQHY